MIYELPPELRIELEKLKQNVERRIVNLKLLVQSFKSFNMVRGRVRNIPLDLYVFDNPYGEMMRIATVIIFHKKLLEVLETWLSGGEACVLFPVELQPSPLADKDTGITLSEVQTELDAQVDKVQNWFRWQQRYLKSSLSQVLTNWQSHLQVEPDSDWRT